MEFGKTIIMKKITRTTSWICDCCKDNYDSRGGDFEECDICHRKDVCSKCCVEATPFDEKSNSLPNIVWNLSSNALNSLLLAIACIIK